jgi:hypothetical protein
MGMAKHKHTLAQIFTVPVPAGIKWRDIEALLRSLGATITEGRGSRVRVLLKGQEAIFHRPHPSPDTDKGVVRAVRRFLEDAGIRR